MNISRPVVTLVVLASFCLNAFFAWKLFRGDGRTVEVLLSTPDQVEVMRTKGGLLEVSSITAPETFRSTKDHTVFSVFGVGQTISEIRVPAVFRYHIELAPEWKITRRGDQFIVIAPRVKPTLPVAIDTARLVGLSAGTWSIFTGRNELGVLQKSITQTLAVKAAAPGYIQFQREAARETVREFVSKWVLAQSRWKTGPKGEIKVFFADEPIDSLVSLPPL